MHFGFVTIQAIFAMVWVVAGLGCSGGDGRSSGGGDSLDTGKLDLLLVVDNSRSMASKQEALEGFFRNLHAELPQTSDIHVAVVTTTAATGPYSSDECSDPTHDDGRFVSSARSTEECEKVTKDSFLAEAVGPEETQRNFSSDLTMREALLCLAAVGVDGCSVAQPLATMARALDGTYSDQRDFVRDDALLAVVIVSDEDDCSASDVSLFDPDRGSLGPLGLRCVSQAARCGNADAPPTLPGVYTDCSARNDSPYLSATDEYIDFLRELKGDAFFVAVVAGDPGPVEIIDNNGSRSLGSSCSGDAVGNARPALRLQQFAEQIPHSQFHSLCARLDDTAAAIGQGIGAARNAIANR